ncbi:hypothetical protein TNCV_383861 [Trichonephila clavipes]|nr:hypothetical protein TNCV_383861 [Trichonephila clavipes]
MIHLGHAGNIPVFSAASDREPLRSSTAFSYYRPESINFIICQQSLDLERREQQYCDIINRNLGTLQFDPYQSQKRAGTHFCFFHQA